MLAPLLLAAMLEGERTAADRRHSPMTIADRWSAWCGRHRPRGTAQERARKRALSKAGMLVTVTDYSRVEFAEQLNSGEWEGASADDEVSIRSSGRMAASRIAAARYSARSRARGGSRPRCLTRTRSRRRHATRTRTTARATADPDGDSSDGARPPSALRRAP